MIIRWGLENEKSISFYYFPLHISPSNTSGSSLSFGDSDSSMIYSPYSQTLSLFTAFFSSDSNLCLIVRLPFDTSYSSILSRFPNFSASAIFSRSSIRWLPILLSGACSPTQFVRISFQYDFDSPPMITLLFFSYFPIFHSIPFLPIQILGFFLFSFQRTCFFQFTNDGYFSRFFSPSSHYSSLIKEIPLFLVHLSFSFLPQFAIKASFIEAIGSWVTS